MVILKLFGYFDNLLSVWEYYSHFLTFELSDDYIENVEKWEKFFEEAGHRKLMITIEVVEE